MLFPLLKTSKKEVFSLKSEGGFYMLEWLILLACPLMMLFCMKGMFSGSGKKDCNTKNAQSTDTSTDVASLQKQMNMITEQNKLLLEEINELKDKRNYEKVVQLDKKNIG